METDVESAFLTSLAQNGPWAAAAAFLLWKIVQAWTQDRQQITSLLTEFKDALVGMKDAVVSMKEAVHLNTQATERLSSQIEHGKTKP